MMRYTRTAIALHWLIALIVFGLFPLGFYMHDLPLSPYKLQLYSYHKWAGMTVLLLAVLRVLWRLTHRPPPFVPGLPRWQAFVAHVVHHGLYLLVLAVPVSGWMMSSALGFPVVWFGVLPLPDLVAKNKELGELLKLVHAVLNYGLLLLVFAHITAALLHHMVDRDGTLARMLPFLDKEKS